jgi:hypothetical protein
MYLDGLATGLCIGLGMWCLSDCLKAIVQKDIKKAKTNGFFVILNIATAIITNI